MTSHCRGLQHVPYKLEVTASSLRACEENIEMATKTKPQDSPWQQDVNSKARKVMKVKVTPRLKPMPTSLLWETLYLRLKTVKEACDIIMGFFEMQNSKRFCYFARPPWRTISCEIQYWFAPIPTAQQAVIKHYQLGLWESSCWCEDDNYAVE